MTPSVHDDKAVAEFCALLPTLRDTAHDEGWIELLRRAETALLEPSAPATVVLGALYRELGLRGITRRGQSVILGYVGQDPSPPPRGIYVCPGPPTGRRCSRAAEREPSAPLPECRLHALPLRFET